MVAGQGAGSAMRDRRRKPHAAASTPWTRRPRWPASTPSTASLRKAAHGSSTRRAASGVGSTRPTRRSSPPASRRRSLWTTLRSASLPHPRPASAWMPNAGLAGLTAPLPGIRRRARGSQAPTRRSSAGGDTGLPGSGRPRPRAASNPARPSLFGAWAGRITGAPPWARSAWPLSRQPSRRRCAGHPVRRRLGHGA